MVNTGRPSAGCKTCRTRRIKCDERKPFCLNCRKACRVCLGYRDQLDVIFRDENQLAQRRASKVSTGSECYSDLLYSPVILSFSVDPDEAVLNQFSRFCILAENNKEGQVSLSAVIPSLYGSARSASPCTPAILAMAWVTSAPFASVSQRMAAARQKYGEAVVKLRDALRDPRTAKADDALFTVLLMLMLENLTATSQSMPNPSKHIYGAIMLVNFRGLQNFASDVARVLFYFVKVTLTALPAWQKTGSFSFSDEVIEADRAACERCESPSLSTRLGNIAFAIAVLRGKLNKAVLDRSNPQTVRDILQQSRNLDQELMAWRISVPQDWETFSSVSPDKPLEDAGSEHSPTWRGFTASYPDLLIAKVLSHFRVHSIAIQAINIRCVNWINRYGCAELPIPEVQIRKDVAPVVDSLTNVKAQNVIRTLVDGICASVPYHLDKFASKGGRRDSIGVAIGPKPPAGGVMLLQLLVVAYSAPGVPADQKRWILGKTLEIAKHIGMDEGMAEKVLNGFASG